MAARHRRVDDVLHRRPRLRQRGLGHLEQDVLLTRHPLQLRHEIAGHLGVGTGIDPMHRGDQQIDQRVSDLPRPAVHIRRQQRHLHLMRMRPQVRGRLGRHPRPPRRQHLRRHIREQALRQAHRADRGQLEHLPLNRLHAHVARLLPDHREHVHPGGLRGPEQRPVVLLLALGGVAGIGALGDQSKQPRDRVWRDAAGDPGGLRLLGLPQRAPDDPAEPVPGRRLDPLLAQVRQQLGADPIDLPFLLSYLDGQPGRGLVCVRNRALPEPEVLQRKIPQPSPDTAAELGVLNRVYLVTRVLPTPRDG